MFGTSGTNRFSHWNDDYQADSTWCWRLLDTRFLKYFSLFEVLRYYQCCQIIHSGPQWSQGSLVLPIDTQIMRSIHWDSPVAPVVPIMLVGGRCFSMIENRRRGFFSLQKFVFQLSVMNSILLKFKLAGYVAKTLQKTSKCWIKRE
jgi:hypothetical protein